MVTELTYLGWKLLVFNESTICCADGTPLNEMWIEDYAEWFDERFSDGDKRFMIGFLFGAYIVGLHVRHLADGLGRGHIPAYGIFSFSAETNNSYKKTDFADIDFGKRSTLFLSGSSKSDNSANKPFACGFENTRKLYSEVALKSETRHGWEALDIGHCIFAKGRKEKSNNKYHG